MSILIYTPYTYLIGWSSLNLWYYGVRFAKGCHPKDLWSPYKTSSRHVKKIIEEFGDPDIIEIRKTFKSANQARRWEERVLQKMKVVGRNDFLNRTDTNNIKTKAISNGLLKYWANLNTEERSNRSAKAVMAMKIARDSIDSATKSAWAKNRWSKLSSEQRTEANQKSKAGSIIYQASLSKEEKSRRAKAAVAATPILTCPHCATQGRKGNMLRWHFDNCRMKTT